MLDAPTPYFWSLCEITETFLHLCQRNQVVVWAEFGTLLGVVRHGNGIIPWDSNGNYGMMAHDREKVISLFADKANADLLRTPSGKQVLLDMQYYDDGRAAIRLEGDGFMQGPLLIIVFYEKVKRDNTNNRASKEAGMNVGESEWVMKPIMSAETIGRCLNRRDYLLPVDKLFPLQQSTLLGMLVYIPHRAIEVLEIWFGTNWKEYPEEFKQYISARYLAPAVMPVREVVNIDTFPDFLSATEQAAAGENNRGLDYSYPLLFRNTSLLSTTEDVFAETITQEPKMLYGYLGKEFEFVELTARDVWQQFREKSLVINVVDSESSFGLRFLPPEWIEHCHRMLSESFDFENAFSWVLTNAPKITPFHIDPLIANGWMKLIYGEKIWWCICGADWQHLQSKGYTLDQIAGMYMSELLRIDDGYLFGRIRVCIARDEDLIWFPIPTLHKVFTTRDSIGFGGYI